MIIVQTGLQPYQTPRSPTPVTPFLRAVSFVQSEEGPLCYKAAHSKSSRSTYMFHEDPLCEHSSWGAQG